MDSDRIKGGASQVTGKVKEEWGDLTDDPKTEAEGKLEQGKGHVQEGWGEAKDEAREADEESRREDDLA